MVKCAGSVAKGDISGIAGVVQLTMSLKKMAQFFFLPFFFCCFLAARWLGEKSLLMHVGKSTPTFSLSLSLSLSLFLSFFLSSPFLSPF